MNASTLAQNALNRAMIRWSLSKAVLQAETATSWLYKVEQLAHSPAALKILKPDAGQDERRGGALLAWYAGEGAATVFDTHEEAVFMEWVDGPPLSKPARNGRDDESTIAAAQVVSSLHKRRPDPPEGLVPLRERMTPLFTAQARSWPHTARDLFARSVGIGLALFDKPQAQIPLHGDLHHDNILSSDRGWLAIDPKGVLGDPAYDLANFFRNPEHAVELAANAARVNRMADIFAERLGYQRRRILGWAAAHCALSACWDIEDDKPITVQLAVLPHLLAAYDAA